MKQSTPFAVAVTVAALGLVLASAFAPGPHDDPRLDSSTLQSTLSAAQSSAPNSPPTSLADVDEPSGPRVAAHAPNSAPGALLSVEGKQRISGIVVDEQQAPVRAARVQLLYGKEPAGLSGLVSRPRVEAQTLLTQETDAAGGFSFEAPKGFWTLRVTNSGMASYEEDAVRPGDFRWITLKPGAELVVRALTEGGAAVADAEVRVVRGRFTDPQAARITKRSDASGEVTLDDVPAGTWFARVAHATHLARVVSLPRQHKGARSLDVVLKKGVVVEGRVTTPDGRAATGASVTFDSDDGLVSSHTVRCDPDGRYRSNIAFPLRSTIELAARASGYGELRREVLLDPGEDQWTIQADVQLLSLERVATGHVIGADSEPLVGAQVYARPLESLPPLTTIQVPGRDELIANGPPNMSAFAPKASHRTLRWLAATTDEHGDFRAASLHPSRPYELLIVAEGHSNATLWMEPGEPGATFDCGAITLRSAGRLAGFVRRADGSGIEGAHVYAVASSIFRIVPDSEITTTRPETLAAGLGTTTSASGYFSIEPFPHVPFHLMCKGVMYGPFEADADGQLDELELVAEDLHRRAAERALPLTLSVTDTLGRPVPKAYVQIELIGDAEKPSSSVLNDWQWARGDASGKVSVNVAEAGQYTVTAKDLEGLLMSQTLVVQVDGAGTSQTIELGVRAEAPGEIEGTVLSHVGEPLANLTVTLIPMAGTTSCNCMKFDTLTDDAGQFTFGSFMEGQHRLIVSDPTGALAPGQLYPAEPGRELTVRM